MIVHLIPGDYIPQDAEPTQNLRDNSIIVAKEIIPPAEKPVSPIIDADEFQMQDEIKLGRMIV